MVYLRQLLQCIVGGRGEDSDGRADGETVAMQPEQAGDKV